MGKIILILGGARSGKSRFAVSLARQYKKVAFIATGEARDKEMRSRIALHKQARPKSWQTFEETEGLAPLLKKVGKAFDCLIIDCLTLWVSNLILSGHKEAAILKKAEALFEVLKKQKGKVIIVSNEVGLGIVPQNRLARVFRDIAGRVNQFVAKEADRVFFAVAGIAAKIK
ncbi:MAG: bifunctional adenosylcobinamide kinase/adenosylcobinamide-phosphate guanylyltransferase [Candidatus Omnitrophota bacterium]